MKRAAAFAALGVGVFTFGAACGAIGLAAVAALEARAERRAEAGSRNGHRSKPRHMPWPGYGQHPAARSGFERY